MKTLKTITHRTLLAAGLAVGLSVAASASATTWRGWNIHSPGYPNSVALKHFAQTITKKTHGDIQATVYNNAVLGDQTDAIQQVSNGAINFANFNMSPMGQYVPKTDILSLPYLFNSVKQMHHVMDGPIGDQFAADMKKKGLVVLSWFDSGARSFYNSKHPITKPSDLKGMKIRVQDNDLYVDMVEALGGNATPMPFSDVYQALKNGVIDGAENNYPSYKETNHYEVAKYYSEDDHLIIPECLCISKISWDALSAKDQKIVRQAAVAAAKEQRRLWAKDSREAKKYVANHGAKINQIKNLKPFQDAMKPVYAKFYKAHPDQKALVQKIRNTQ